MTEATAGRVQEKQSEKKGKNDGVGVERKSQAIECARKRKVRMFTAEKQKGQKPVSLEI